MPHRFAHHSTHRPRISILRSFLGLFVATTLLPTVARAQENGAPVRRVISIDDHPRVDGLRFNFRDRLALGRFATGVCGDLHGAAIGGVGVRAARAR